MRETLGNFGPETTGSVSDIHLILTNQYISSAQLQEVEHAFTVIQIHPPHRSSTPMFPAAQEATRRRVIRSHKISAFPAGSSGFFSYSLPAVNPASTDTTREDRLASLSARRSQILAKKRHVPFQVPSINRYG